MCVKNPLMRDICRARAVGQRAADLYWRGKCSAIWRQWYAGRLHAEVLRWLEYKRLSAASEYSSARQRSTHFSEQPRQRMMLDLFVPAAEFEPDEPSPAGKARRRRRRWVATLGGPRGCVPPSPAPMEGRQISVAELCAQLGTDPTYTAWAHQRFQDLLAAIGDEMR
jgi:hypothetical protein